MSDNAVTAHARSLQMPRPVVAYVQYLVQFTETCLAWSVYSETSDRASWNDIRKVSWLIKPLITFTLISPVD
jgi:hypothetical protein